MPSSSPPSFSYPAQAVATVSPSTAAEVLTEQVARSEVGLGMRIEALELCGAIAIELSGMGQRAKKGGDEGNDVKEERKSSALSSRGRVLRISQSLL